MPMPSKTVTSVANVCNRSAEWVRYHADRGNIPCVKTRIGNRTVRLPIRNIPCVKTRIGNRTVRLFDEKALRVAKKLAGGAP